MTNDFFRSEIWSHCITSVCIAPYFFRTTPPFFWGSKKKILFDFLLSLPSLHKCFVAFIPHAPEAVNCRERPVCRSDSRTYLAVAALLQIVGTDAHICPKKAPRVGLIFLKEKPRADNPRNTTTSLRNIVVSLTFVRETPCFFRTTPPFIVHRTRSSLFQLTAGRLTLKQVGNESNAT